MNRNELLLTILSEECAETAHRASKAVRFTVEEIQEGQPLNNGERILEELHDLLAVVEMLQQEGVLPYWSDYKKDTHIQTKKQKIEQYLLYSRSVGALKD